MNIDFIMNGGKPKKQVTNGLMDLFKGQSNPNPTDRVTKSQHKVLRSGKNMFGDWDGDGVINGLDCQPRNPLRHNVRGRLFDNRLNANNEQYGSSTNINRATGKLLRKAKGLTHNLNEIKSGERYKNDPDFRASIQNSASGRADEIHSEDRKILKQRDYRRHMKRDDGYLKEN